MCRLPIAPPATNPARVVNIYCEQGPGFFLSTTLVIYTGYVLALTLLVLAMLRMESYFLTPGHMHDLQFTDEGKPNFGTQGREETFNAQFLFQLGFLTLMPLIAEEWLEFGASQQWVQWSGYV